MPRVSDHAGSPGSRAVAPGHVAFHHLHGVGTQDETLSRLNGWPMHSPVNASPRPSRAHCASRSRCGSVRLHRKGLAPYSLPVSRRFANVFALPQPGVDADPKHFQVVPELVLTGLALAASFDQFRRRARGTVGTSTPSD
jgi:hypothetical protein